MTVMPDKRFEVSSKLRDEFENGREYYATRWPNDCGRWARPMKDEWAISIRDQCLAQGVDFFFKQWGAWFCYVKVITARISQ